MGTEHWNIDPSHSGIHFSVRHLVIAKVRGAFLKFAGAIDFDAADPSGAKVEVSIETASVDTREPKRDEHLRSADFLDVATYPAMTFTSAAVEKRKGDEYAVLGDLTLHGVTKRVELDVTHLGRGKDPWGGERISFEAKTSLDRGDFGLKFNMPIDGGGLLVGEKIEITLDIEAVKQA